MEIDEVAARLVRQYWALMVVCLIAPICAIALITIRQPKVYAADARIVTGTVVPASAAQANAIVSQVQAIATSRTAVSKALFAADVTRSLKNFIASHISVAGLGGSQVVDLTVTDTSARVARTVAGVLATEVVTSINNVGQSGLSAALLAVDKEILRLTESRSVLSQQIAANPKNQALQAKLVGLDEVLASFSGDRGRLLIQASTAGLATVIDKPALPNQPVSKALPQKLGLAGVLGLVAAILLASIAETARPTVPGARRVGRRLGAPTLGQLTAGELAGVSTPGLINMALRLQLAAAHAGVNTVALVDIDSRRPLAGLAAGLERGLAELSPRGGSLHPAVVGNHLSGGLARVSVTAGAGVLTRNHETPDDHEPLRVFPMGQMKHLAGSGDVGLLVLSGPVARVSRITALDDLMASSGWPILGVVAVPRARRGQAQAPAVAQQSPPAGSPVNGADAEHATAGADAEPGPEGGQA